MSSIKTRPQTKEYDDNYDKIFRKENKCFNETKCLPLTESKTHAELPPKLPEQS